MNPKHGNTARTKRENELIQRLRSRPDLWERFEAILALTEAEGGALRTADAVEALLAAEVRRLGREAMHDWAARAEERTAREFQSANPKATVRKKKP
jgi:hypothetical protein